MVAKANLVGSRFTNLTVVGEFYQLREGKTFYGISAANLINKIEEIISG